MVGFAPEIVISWFKEGRLNVSVFFVSQILFLGVIFQGCSDNVCQLHISSGLSPAVAQPFLLKLVERRELSFQNLIKSDN